MMGGDPTPRGEALVSAIQARFASLYSPEFGALSALASPATPEVFPRFPFGQPIVCRLNG